MAAKMSKKVRNLIIGAVVLLILIAALVILLLNPKETAEEESSESYTTSTSVVSLIESDSDTINKVVVVNPNGSYEIDRTRKATDDEDAVYGIAELAGFTENTGEYSSLLDQFCNFSASRLIEENAPDIAKYGLEKPAYTITLYYDDGTQHEIRVGNQLPTGSGYYMMLDDDKNVYGMAEAKMERLNYTALDYMDKNVIEPWVAYTDEDGNAVSAPTIGYLQVEGGTLEDVFRIVPISAEETSSYGSTYKIVSPFEADMKFKSDESGNDQHLVYTSGLQQLTADSVAVLHPAEEEFAAYGLAEPYCTISFSRDDTEYVWYVGDAATASDGSAAHYLYSEDQPVIYLVADSNLPWISIDIEDMYSSLMLLPFIDDVEKIDLMVYDKTYTIEVDAEKDENDKTILTPHLDGKEMQVDAYRKMYQYLLAAPAEGINKSEEQGTLVASFTYCYRDGGSDTIELFDLGNRTCILSINGNRQWTTRISYVQHLETNIEKFENGEIPSLDY